jgi:YD repeat-containing protein
LTTHDHFDYEDNWWQTSGSDSESSHTPGPNEADGWANGDASSNWSVTDTWNNNGTIETSGTGGSTDSPTDTSYYESISSPGFGSGVSYPDPGLSLSLSDPGSPCGDGWVMPAPTTASQNVSAAEAATAALSSTAATSATAASSGGQAASAAAVVDGPVYNSAGQVTSLTDADGDVTGFTYDSSGNLTSLTDPDGNTTSWTYDPQGQMVQQTTSLGSSFYGYNSAGQLSRYTDADGRVTSYEYNSQNELTQESWYADTADANAGQNPEDTFNYTYNSAGEMTSESDNTTSDTYVYDSSGRLTSVTESAAGSPTVVLAYTYPAGPCLLSSDPTSVSATIDGTPDFLDTFQYNAQGQLTQIDRSGQPGGDAVQEVQVDLTYNASGQLLGIDRYQSGQFVAQSVYTYDSLGRLVSLVDSQGSRILASYTYAYASDDPSQPVTTAASILSSIDPSQPILPPDDPNQIALASLDQSPSATSVISSVTSVDGTASYSYDPGGQLTGAAYSGSPLPSGEGQGEGLSQTFIIWHLSFIIFSALLTKIRTYD